MQRSTFLHIDLDSFFVAVERLRNPKLMGLPVIVGGKSRRGVVAACSYEARQFGLHSAMPIMTARRLCPHGIYLSGDSDAYTYYSTMVTDIIADKAPLFEKASIDEFYLDLTGMDRFFGCQQWAWELRETIHKETGLPLSAGLSINKTVCKIATGEAKPDGKKYVPQEEVKNFLRPLVISKMPMIGEVTSQTLQSLGISTIGQLMDFPMELLQRTMGKNGASLWKRANGIDPTPIIPYTEARSISAERTFAEDTMDMKQLHSALLGMVEKLAYRMRADDRMTGCVTIKLRYSDFQTETRQVQINYTSRDDLLINAVKELFEKCYTRRLQIRLIGVRFSKLVPGSYQLQLFDTGEKHAWLMMAMDKIRNRYGLQAVSRVNGLYTSGDTHARAPVFISGGKG